MPQARDCSNEMAFPSLPNRTVDAHKGDFGLVLIIGGSRGMSGAPSLAGMAALRSGAGLVRVAVPDACLDTVAAHDPCYMTVPLPSSRSGKLSLDAWPLLRDLAEEATVVAIGPGLGRSLAVDTLVTKLYAKCERPMVVDADGLNALATRPTALPHAAGPRILTPHPGEFARLAGSMPHTNDDRRKAARKFAARIGQTVVLKGAGTVISNGEVAYVNATGNPGMATGGSGDVLTGLVAALWAQGLTAIDAARMGAHLHGRAGDIAAEQVGEESLTAVHLVQMLSAAFQEAKS